MKSDTFVTRDFAHWILSSHLQIQLVMFLFTEVIGNGNQQKREIISGSELQGFRWVFLRSSENNDYVWVENKAA